MAEYIKEVMTPNPVTLSSSSSIAEAAKCMLDEDIGAVVVEDDGKLCGIVTDRDIAIRAVAMGRDPKRTTLGDICSKSVRTLSPEDEVDSAVALMRENALRRVPVVDRQQKLLGIVSLGDLAQRREPRSALGQISAAPPNH
jgi:CBS-domain-containing membrane protein